MHLSWLESFKFFEEGYIMTNIAPLVESAARKEDSGSDSALLVFAGNERSPSGDSIAVLRRNPKAGVMILSDEMLKHSFRGHRRRRYVFRNYFQPQWSSKRVFTLPLGYHSSFVGLSSPVSESRERRANIWAFVGEMKLDREEMLRAFNGLRPNELFRSAQFDDPLGIRGKQLYELYASSLFVLCPFGNRSPETFRLMEALEAGAVPVTVSFAGLDPFRFVFGNHPFIVGRDWTHASELVRQIVDSPEALRDKQNETRKWYESFRSDLQADISAILLGRRRSRLVSPQFRYQLKAARNPVVRLKYAFHYTPRGRRLLRACRRFVTVVAQRLRDLD